MTTIWSRMCYNYIRRQVIMVLSPCCLPTSTFHPLHKRFLQFPLKQIWFILGQKLFFTFMHRAWNTWPRSQLCELHINRSGLTLSQCHLCPPSNSQLWPLSYMGILQLPPGNAPEISKPFIDLLFCVQLGQNHKSDLLHYFTLPFGWKYLTDLLDNV